jgi:hypothetical protein
MSQFLQSGVAVKPRHRRCRWLFVFCCRGVSYWAALSTLALACMAHAAAESVPPASRPPVVKAEPAAIPVGTSTLVTVTAKVRDDRHHPVVRVKLLRYNSKGKLVATLGTMNDAGKRGDDEEDDNIYTGRFWLDEANPQGIVLVAAVTRKGLPEPVLGETHVVVRSAERPDEAITSIVSELERGDMEAARQRFGASERNVRALALLDTAEQLDFAYALRNARLVEQISDNLRLYAIRYERAGLNIETPLLLGRNPLGQWKVITW